MYGRTNKKHDFGFGRGGKGVGRGIKLPKICKWHCSCGQSGNRLLPKGQAIRCHRQHVKRAKCEGELKLEMIKETSFTSDGVQATRCET